jgi:cell filamentation protein
LNRARYQLQKSIGAVYRQELAERGQTRATASAAEKQIARRCITLHNHCFAPNHDRGFLNCESEPPRMHPSEQSVAEARYAALSVVEPSLTSNGYLALHAALFGASDAAAGQVRRTALAWDEYYFAHVPMIALSLEQRFEALTKISDLQSLAREDFFDVLAHHISELHAISPFRSGNRRTLALHAEQIAHAAGHAIHTCTLDKGVWDEVLTISFIHKDHRGIAHLLKGAPIPVDLFPKSIVGDDGLPRLPDRDASQGRRYLQTLRRARRELEEYLQDARDEAMAQLITLTNYEAHPSQLMSARQELGFLRHPRGPIFQAAMLDAINFGTITPAVHGEQSALERVREIATSILVGIAQQPRGQLEYLIETVYVPEYTVRGSPHQDRLATQFLTNTAEQNHADQRFAACQRAVDEIVAKIKRTRAANLERIATESKRARRAIALRIRSGDMMTADMKTQASPRSAQAG